MPRPRKPPRLARVPRRPFWYIRDGRDLASTGTEDRQEAERWLADWIARKGAPPPDPTIAAILDARLADLKAAGKARASNTPHYHAKLKSRFGPLYPRQLAPSLIAEYAKWRAATPASLREELLELRTALNFAVRAGWIVKAPYIDVPNKRAPRRRFLSHSQAETLLAAAKPLHLRLFIIIAMTTGARAGAILGLTWDRVDFKRGRIDFTDPALAETKKRRTVAPIQVPVAAALRDARIFAMSDHVIEYMGKPVASIRTAWRKAATEAGVSWACPHVLKHSVISWLAEAGVTVDRIADLTATSRETVLRIYRKFSPEYLRPEAELLSNAPGLANELAKLGIDFAIAQERKTPANRGLRMVGAAGIEPATPTMST